MSVSPKALLESYAVQPKKSLGQNFMHDPNMLDKVVKAADVTGSDIVVEVGAGTGALTDVLARVAGQVFAIEIDERMRPLLEERFEERENVYLVFGDILKTDVNALLAADDYLVVANMPYYISTAILWRFLEARRAPRRLVVTMQYEVAERIIGTQGAMHLLSMAVQFYGEPSIMGKLSPAVFWPRPNIDSAIVRIETHTEPPVNVPSRAAFFRVLRAGFRLKRKQLKNSLGSGLGIRAREAAALLQAAGVDPQRRAETLSLQEWARLSWMVEETQAAL